MFRNRLNFYLGCYPFLEPLAVLDNTVYIFVYIYSILDMRMSSWEEKNFFCEGEGMSRTCRTCRTSRTGRRGRGVVSFVFVCVGRWVVCGI